MERLEAGTVRRPILAVLVVLGAASCQGVLGIQDRSLDPTLDGSTSQEGSVGNDGGADGNGGQDGTTADAPGSDGGTDAPAADGSNSDAPACADPCMLASGLNHPFLMTSDVMNVYWTEFGDDQGSGNGAVKGCPASGCGSGPTVYAQGLTNPRGLAVDATHIYFGTATYGGVNGGIWSCPLSGCGGSPTLVAPASIPFGLAVDGLFVYWVDNDANTVNKIAKLGGGSTIVLNDGGPYDDAGDSLGQLAQLVVDGTYMFFGDQSEDVFRLSVTGDTPVLLANTVNGGSYGSAFGITTDVMNVYSGGNGIIVGASKLASDGGSAVANGIPAAIGLAYDAASGMVYWANYGGGTSNDGTVGKFAAGTGVTHVLQASLTTPEAIALAGGYALWLSNGTLNSTGTAPSTGSLWRTAK